MSNIPIILATVNARYVHASLGLRCLWSNLGVLQSQAAIREFTLNHSPAAIAEDMLAASPAIVGLGIYVWNVTLLTQVAQIVKRRQPNVVMVIGGPEVSYEYQGTALFETTDFLITGEAESAFPVLAQAVLAGQRPQEKVIEGAPANLAEVSSPYGAYSASDLQTRLTYVEASRGCPFRCAFCLSSLEKGVREFPLDVFLVELEQLLERGARRIKFVDRTFNLKPDRVKAILQHLLSHWRDGLQVHFEIVPDRISDDTLGLMEAFPAGGLRLEVGVQTFNPVSQAAILRVQDLAKTEKTLHCLRQRTGAIIHADLIVGLPGETLGSFGSGFDRLFSLRPDEIQVGILKRLKGTGIAEKQDLVFSQEPPYEVIETPWVTQADMMRLKRFARYFEIYHNAHQFPEGMDLLLRAETSAFDALMRFFDWVWERTGRTHRITLAEQAELLYEHLVNVGVREPDAIARVVEKDFRRLPGRKDKLSFCQ